MDQLLCIFSGVISQQEHCARYQTLCTSLYHSVSLDFSVKNYMVMSYYNLIYGPADMCLALVLFQSRPLGLK